jgi:N-acetylneuraminate lyase
MEAFENNEMDRARQLQELSVQMVRVLHRYGGLPAIKATMGLLGCDCGPCRLPLQTLHADQVEDLGQDLDRIGLFRWQQGEIQLR